MSLCSVLRRVTFCCLRSLHVLPRGVCTCYLGESANVVPDDCYATLQTFRSENAEASLLGLCWGAAHTRFSKCELEDLLLHVVAWIPLRGAFEERWKIFVGKLWSFRNYFVSLPTSIADTSLKRCWPHGAWFPERRVAVRFLRVKKKRYARLVSWNLRNFMYGKRTWWLPRIGVECYPISRTRFLRTSTCRCGHTVPRFSHI